MKKILLVTILILGVLFYACGDDTVKSPSAVINSVTNQFFVDGAGVTDVNGIFIDSGTIVNGKILFTNINNLNGFIIHFGELAGFGITNSWSLTLPGSTHMYTNSSLSLLPPTSGWLANWSGHNPAPTIRYCDGITGLNIVGQTLQASYTYSDPDSVAEGATVFQWFRGDTQTDATNIVSGQNASSYILTSADLGKYLKVSIVPVNEKGAIGTNIITSSVFGPIQ